MHHHYLTLHNKLLISIIDELVCAIVGVWVTNEQYYVANIDDWNTCRRRRREKKPTTNGKYDVVAPTP